MPGQRTTWEARARKRMRLCSALYGDGRNGYICGPRPWNVCQTLAEPK